MNKDVMIKEKIQNVYDKLDAMFGKKKIKVIDRVKQLENTYKKQSEIIDKHYSKHTTMQYPETCIICYEEAIANEHDGE